MTNINQSTNNNTCVECCGASCSHISWGLLLIRSALAGVFLFHGITKFLGMAGTIAFFDKLGLPAPIAYLVALGETAAGLAMLLGVFTRYAGGIIVLIMIGAIYLVKFPAGGLVKAELELVLLFVALGISLAGPGTYTIRRLFKK
ncbi:MAG: DoxX family protein [bacterium]|nr:DoxX family protein [bacterium]